jgi:hypothetical protein
MPSARQPTAKPAATIVNATARTQSVIEDLQARLTADTRTRTPEPQPIRPAGAGESIDDLERQLQAYFERATPTSSRTKILDELRSRVIDGVVDRIMADWAEWAKPQQEHAGLAAEVMERLIERVLDQLQSKSFPRP